MKSKEQKAIDVQQKRTQHDLLSPREKINKLDARLGKDIGARKERLRLEFQLSTLPD